MTDIPNLTALADRYYAAGDFTRKAESYLREYEQLLGPHRDVPLRILELGVSSGASLLLWRDYLPRATIVGIDINPMPAMLAGHDRLHFLQGSQDDLGLLDRAAAIAGGPFDLIVDDASHIGYLTKRSFNYLFRTWLKPGGTYVIEDFGTGYMPEYPDGGAFVPVRMQDAEPGTREFVSHQFGMVGVVKQLVDHMMQQLMTGVAPPIQIARLVVLTNLAFVDKYGEPAGPIGLDHPAAPVAVAVAAGVPDAAMAARVDALEQRLAAVETTLGRFLSRLEPLRRIKRLFG